MNLLKKCNKFYGNDSSTVSNYLSYLFYINQKEFDYHNFNYQIKNNINYHWIINNIYGPGISWKLFWKENITF